MVKQIEPDRLLIKMPSLRAVKAFVAAAKYSSFSRAAESLCVTPAAISRQIKELEDLLGTALFARAGRAVRLTAEGVAFFETAQLAFMNIAQAADRLRQQARGKAALTVCCTPAFANLWLAPRLPAFSAQHPEVELNIVATHHFQQLDAGVRPDVFITQAAHIQPGYSSVKLFGEAVYPVCSPAYFSRLPRPMSLEHLREAALLNLSPHGRAALAEYLDWDIWLGLHNVPLAGRGAAAPNLFSANDYSLLIQLAEQGLGIALGWHHLVEQRIAQGRLVRLAGFELVQPQTFHYLALREAAEQLPAAECFKAWVLSALGAP
ncbi:LysR substrate-binding domain-containing protein [Pseudomonas sp. NPDC007930]|uniref:LysR substrate-binding domain-containing protein n=1 Tax=Pseudomonas sp. NPDC007930 TaxID=3364417 RepID=UPI0036E108CF